VRESERGLEKMYPKAAFTSRQGDLWYVHVEGWNIANVLTFS
jgi:hypothetical protein